MVHHSIDFKKSAVKYYLKIKNYVEVCKIYECNRSSLKDRFLDFLQKNILLKMKDKLLLFDNARIHVAKVVLYQIKSGGNDYVLNIPYNPQTNPIESFFS